MPLIARMSCGAGLPSTMKSPFSTMSPSCRWMCLPFGIRYSLSLLGLVHRLDRDAALVLVVAAEADGAGDFRDDGRVLWLAGLEQFGHPRQTAGDVAGLGAFGRNTRQNVAWFHLCADVDRENRVDRQHVAGITATGELEDLAILALDDDRRTQIRPAPRRPPVDDDALGDTGGFVERFRDRLALDQILEPDDAFDFGQNGRREYGSHSAMRWPRLTISPSSTCMRAPY